MIANAITRERSSASTAVCDKVGTAGPAAHIALTVQLEDTGIWCSESAPVVENPIVGPGSSLAECGVECVDTVVPARIWSHETSCACTSCDDSAVMRRRTTKRLRLLIMRSAKWRLRRTVFRPPHLQGRALRGLEEQVLICASRCIGPEAFPVGENWNFRGRFGVILWGNS